MDELISCDTFLSYQLNHCLSMFVMFANHTVGLIVSSCICMYIQIHDKVVPRFRKS